MPLPDRVALAGKLAGARRAVAETVTDDFLRRHPEWVERYGDRGRALGVEDACFHIDFLIGAIEAGAPLPFQEYVRWSTRMLAARGIAPRFLAENLAQIGGAFAPMVSAAEHALVTTFVQAGVEASGERVPAEAERSADSELSEMQRLFTQAALRGQRQAATSMVLEALDAGHGALGLYSQVFQASQYEVGRLWEANRITVAQEHLATAVTQFVLAQVYARMEPAETHRGNMVITGVEGELHQLGANMVADVLEAEGWDVRFLGTHMPHGGIIQAIEEHEATVVGISATMLFSVPRVRSLVEDVRKRFGDSTRVVLGGSAFRFSEDACRELGADGFAGDLESTLQLLCGPR